MFDDAIFFTEPPAKNSTLDAVLAEIRRLRHAIERPQANPPAPACVVGDSDILVTLDQCAALIHKSKSRLYKLRAKLPDPAVSIGGGHANLYRWGEMRAALMRVYGITLPQRFPTPTR
jgi:hypothetical protein